MSGDHNEHHMKVEAVWDDYTEEERMIEEGLDNIPLITVTELKENEDGSATAQVDASPEGTRMLVELGLISLLEKAIDKDNTEYTIKDGLHE